jgi:hypothetical protein
VTKGGDLVILALRVYGCIRSNPFVIDGAGNSANDVLDLHSMGSVMRHRMRTFPTIPVLALLLAACGPSRLPPIGRVTPVAADSGEEVSGWTVLAGTDAAGGSVLWAPVTAAFLFGQGDKSAVPMRAGDSLPLRIEFGNWGSRLHGRVVSIDLKVDGALRWLALAPPGDLAALRYVSVPDSVPAAMLAALSRLAAVNPGIMLGLEDSTATVSVLPLFRPSALVISGDDGSLPALLPRQPQLAELWLGDEEITAPVGAAVLALPNLRRLVITANMDSMPRLPAGLEELTIQNDRELDAHLLSGLSGLRVLRLSAVTWTNGSDLAALKSLRWLAPPRNVSQREFDAMVAAHPGLETLELQETDSVTDLSALRRLPHLKALALDGTSEQLAVVKELRTLEYLALREAADEDLMGDVVAVRTALPATTLVEWRPMCLGSGWILLLLPAIALIALSWRRPQPA